MAKENLNEHEEDDFSDDELVIHKKKAPEQKKGVTAEAVLNAAASALKVLRTKSPLVQCMTSAATTGLFSGAIQALNGEAVTIEDMGEASQFTSVTDALFVNVGAVTKMQADAMRAAVSHANMSSKPWVLDTQRVGVLPLRTFTVKELMRRFPAIIRGDANEINFLVTNVVPNRGDVVEEAAIAQSSLRLAGVTRSAVIVSGEIDYVAVEGAPVVAIHNGNPVMARVAGLGAVQGAVCAAFLCAIGSKFRWEAALATSLIMSVAGEMAAKASKGPGTFVPAFIDALVNVTPEDVLKFGKVKIMPVAG